MTEIPHVSVSELHPTVQADVRYNDSLVEGLELPCWLIQALAHEAMEHNILAAQGRRLIIESWVRLPDGAVYTQWLRDLLLAWLSKQLGRDVRLEEIRWFFALNTAGANPEKELLDWHLDRNGRIRSCWSLGAGAIAFRVKGADDAATWQSAQALSLTHGSVYTMGLTASGNDKGPVRHRTWPEAVGDRPDAHLRFALFMDWPLGSALPAATTPLPGVPANLPMPPAPAPDVLAKFASGNFKIEATPGLVWDNSVSAHFGGLHSQENRANLGLPILLPWPQDVCMSKDIVEIEEGVRDVCSRGGTQLWKGLGTTTMNRKGPLAGTVRTLEQQISARAFQSIQDWQSGRLAVMLAGPQQPPNMPRRSNSRAGTIVCSRLTEQAKLHHLEGVLKKKRMPEELWLQEHNRYLELYDPKRLFKPQPKKARAWLVVEKHNIMRRLHV